MPVRLGSCLCPARALTRGSPPLQRDHARRQARDQARPDSAQWQQCRVGASPAPVPPPFAIAPSRRPRLHPQACLATGTSSCFTWNQSPTPAAHARSLCLVAAQTTIKLLFCWQLWPPARLQFARSPPVIFRNPHYDDLRPCARNPSRTAHDTSRKLALFCSSYWSRPSRHRDCEHRVPVWAPTR